ncbi:unnamed protein product [Echinostoma caproni]|uniref:C2H2-type domain-containing protein n=1 Tax=Echinostoma caproni TaxID=27848 RepID=A0A183AIR7_9TREM|nr:unnamed protein product [Echinostoma caproni]
MPGHPPPRPAPRLSLTHSLHNFLIPSGFRSSADLRSVWDWCTQTYTHVYTPHACSMWTHAAMSFAESAISDDSLRSPVTGICILPTPDPPQSSNGITVPVKSNEQHKFIRLTRSAKVIERLARIPNRIGDYVCRLCSTWFADAFALAEHMCPRMANLAYPCDLCPKVSST